MFRTRAGLATCSRFSGPGRDRPPARMSSGAHAARFLLLYFAQTASPILVLHPRAMLAQHGWSTHAVPGRGRRCPVGATLRDGWKKSACSRSAQARSFHARRRCLSEAPSGARSEFRGAGSRSISSSEVGVEQLQLRMETVMHEPLPGTACRDHPAPPAATPDDGPNQEPSPQPSPRGRGSEPAGEGASATLVTEPPAQARSIERPPSRRRCPPSGGPRRCGHASRRR
jgi:hypothetical protein